jgi:pimeloyl-ACP methyl ester carboxylesterase
MATKFQRSSSDDGQTFVYANSGEGPLVVLLHGFPDTPDTWDRIRVRLNHGGFRTVAPYLRGYHSETIVAARPYDAETIAADALRLLDALAEEQAVFVGHDWGAAIVYWAASLDPGRVRAIVPIGIPHPSLLRASPRLLFGARHFLSLRLPWAELTVRRRGFAYLETLYRRWAPTWSGPDREACLAQVKSCFTDSVALHGALAYYRALSPRPPATVTRRVAVPGLVVGGTEDLVDAGTFRRSPNAFDAHCEVLVLDGVGHWPHREAEHLFVDALLTFLQSLH